MKNLGFCCLPGLGSNFGFGLSSMLPPLMHPFYLGAYCEGSQLMLRPERGKKKSKYIYIFLFETEKQTPNYLGFLSMFTAVLSHQQSSSICSALPPGSGDFTDNFFLTCRSKSLYSSVLVPHLSPSLVSALIPCLPRLPGANVWTKEESRSLTRGSF